MFEEEIEIEIELEDEVPLAWFDPEPEEEEEEEEEFFFEEEEVPLAWLEPDDFEELIIVEPEVPLSDNAKASRTLLAYNRLKRYGERAIFRIHDFSAVDGCYIGIDSQNAQKRGRRKLIRRLID